jgi:tetratricopeptide (TPR) repeat protein
VRDILASPPARRFDFVLCAGALNYRIPDHERWTAAMIARMYELADRAAVVNMLNATVIGSLRMQLGDRGELLRARPEDVLRFCRTLTPRVEIADACGASFAAILRRPAADTVAQLARALGVTDGDSESIGAVVEVAFRRGLYAQLRDFLRALPPTATTVEWIARTHAVLGERSEAIAEYERAAALAPARAEVCVSLGRVLREVGRDDDAQRWFREALARDPHQDDGRYELVLSLLREGDRESARAIALATVAGPLRDVLDARTASDRDAILAAYERALAAAPRFLDAITGVATAYEERGRWREATALRERAAGITGEDPRARPR